MSLRLPIELRQLILFCSLAALRFIMKSANWQGGCGVSFFASCAFRFPGLLARTRKLRYYFRTERKRLDYDRLELHFRHEHKIQNAVKPVFKNATRDIRIPICLL